MTRRTFVLLASTGTCLAAAIFGACEFARLHPPYSVAYRRAAGDSSQDESSIVGRWDSTGADTPDLAGVPELDLSGVLLQQQGGGGGGRSPFHSFGGTILDPTGQTPATPGAFTVANGLQDIDGSRYAAEIAWETEVWLADTPDHMIHFNGEKFLGPHRD